MNPTPIPRARGFAPTTGLPGLDAVLSGVAPGDNIVWQIQSLADYGALVRPYAAAALARGDRLIYFRFASHATLLPEDGGAEIHRPRPEDGFDAFVDQVHSVIEAAGPQALYVFDCLSELADAWQSDRMLGNFFRLTCPRLFDLDTVTYFGVLRNRHAHAGMDMITETTQYLLDVFRCRDRLYVKPIKVQHRSAAAMNLIHAWEAGDRFRPVADSGTVAEIVRRAKVGHVLHIGVSEKTEQAAQALTKIPGVKKIAIAPDDTPAGGVDKRILHLSFEEAGGASFSDIPNILVNQGYRITKFTEEPVNLETAFMRLTKGLVQ